ncbi:Hsp20/alpha crystallin family protein [Candidatus Berkelbacteria bacterium]|nr:Hsp20/alpha crystallin family protein [Candidatus Berkelbacteria bacterium]MBI2588522.1 Hsp20/alpha crystallin family protein [Candidatus Berkelbacteria bacterium]MBI4029709.1 Hsp20/alpha crystallin family protein [Candidatus Berkelbacteria bacterium]
MTQQEKTEFLETKGEDWLSDYEEGQVALDVYQTDDNMIIKAPIAGVKKEDLDVEVTDEVVIIKGERREQEEKTVDNYFTQECYWGAFTRSYVLPVAVDSSRAKAVLKDGILTVTIPKLEKTKTRTLKVEAE